MTMLLDCVPSGTVLIEKVEQRRHNLEPLIHKYKYGHKSRKSSSKTFNSFFKLHFLT